MRVLDLDLDFFLDDIAYHRGPYRRASRREFRPWTESAVIEFLEGRCGLSTSKPLPGRVIRQHYQAFVLWRELIESCRLEAPFDIVHVDAHADMGCGDSGYLYLMTYILHRPLAKRCKPRIGHNYLNSGNYLSFVAACRWMRSFTFVTHPEWRDDLMHMHYKDRNPDTGFIQLKRCSRLAMENWADRLNGDMEVEAYEPEIPFRRIAGDSYAADGSFDYVLLCQSPGFTPVTADALIPVFERYIDPI